MPAGGGSDAVAHPELKTVRRRATAASGAGFTPLGAAKRTRLMSGGEFTSPPRKARAGDAGDAKSSEARQASTPRVRCDAPASHLVARGGLGGAPLAPPSSRRRTTAASPARRRSEE